MTQTERVFHALKAAGPRGITQVDFLRTPTFDGGAPITRIAARVEELRDQGLRISSGERREKCVVYRLLEHDLKVEETRQVVSPSPVVSDEPGWDRVSLGGASGEQPASGSSETTEPFWTYKPGEGWTGNFRRSSSDRLEASAAMTPRS